MAITPMKNDAYKYETLHDFDIRYVCVPKHFRGELFSFSLGVHSHCIFVSRIRTFTFKIFESFYQNLLI